MRIAKKVFNLFGVDPERPLKRGLIALGVAALVLVAGIALQAWYSLLDHDVWTGLVVVLFAVAFATSLVNLDHAWTKGRGSRQRTRPFERVSAGLGYGSWGAGTFIGCVLGIVSGVQGYSVFALIAGGFGVLFFLIGVLLGGMPSPERGLTALLLTKRIANWQIAFSLAIVAPIVGRAAQAGDKVRADCLKSTGVDSERCMAEGVSVLDVVGYNHGYLFMTAAAWLVGSGLATVLYEPLKYRLEENENSATPVGGDPVES